MNGYPQDRAEDEFYVGYLPKAPVALARHLRGTVLVLAVLASLAAAILSGAHRRLMQSTFEFGVKREFSGVVMVSPCPSLWVERRGSAQGGGQCSRYLLVSPGKHGAEELGRRWNGLSVRLEGSLVYRDGWTMLEVDPDSVVADPPKAEPPAVVEESLGTHTFVGEIVDSKCFLGVMNPGESKTHRDCAVRCISGGIPPVLCVRDPLGRADYFLLVDVDGAPVNDRVLDLVAEPVEITGEWIRVGDLAMLRADPATYRRL